jgi:probable F420-dependent oxidoreductase
MTGNRYGIARTAPCARVSIPRTGAYVTSQRTYPRLPPPPDRRACPCAPNGRFVMSRGTLEHDSAWIVPRMLELEGADVRLGVIFPQSEITADVGAVRAYTEAAEELGYAHLLAYDHVVGADLTNRPDFRGPYNLHTMFHEPFVLYGFMAAITQKLEFATGIVILPQRQTVLVAKQAAQVDVLSGGRFRLGVGIGWNDVEYQALGQDFRTRAARSEEQIVLLRQLFSQESVTFAGRWDTVEAAGINPLPTRRSIPIWIGGAAEATLRRVVRLGDGWFPQMPPDQARPMLDRLRELAREKGRDPESIGIEARVNIAGKDEEIWISEVRAWKEMGATHLAVNTMSAGLTGPSGHIDAIRRFRDAVFPIVAA